MQTEYQKSVDMFLSFVFGIPLLILIFYGLAKFFKGWSDIPWTGQGKASERFRKRGGKFPDLGKEGRDATFSKIHWKYKRRQK